MTIGHQSGLFVDFVHQLGCLQVGYLNNGKILQSSRVTSQQLGHLELGVLVAGLQLEGEQDLAKGGSGVPGKGFWLPVSLHVVDRQLLLGVPLVVLPQLQVDTLCDTGRFPRGKTKVCNPRLLTDEQLPSSVEGLVGIVRIDIARVS